MSERMRVVMAGLLALVLLGAACPNCGGDKIVVLDGGKVVIEGPVTLKIIAPPTPEPEPPAWDSPFPKGPGVWVYDNAYNDAMLAWMKLNGLTWMQNWSHAYRPRGLPYAYEIQAGLQGKRSFDSDLVKVRERLQRHSQSPDFVGVNLNCETAWNDTAEAVFQMIRAEFPDVKIFTGPLGWDCLTKLGWFRRFDGVMTFWNCTRYQRRAADFYYQEAMANAVGLPWCISIQPVDSEKNMALADPARFKVALDLAAKYADGINLWKMEGIWRVATGRTETTTPERLDEILDAIKNVAQSSAPDTRQELRIYHYMPVNDEGKVDSWKFHQVRMICRVVGRAGFKPIAVATLEEADITMADFIASGLYDRAVLMKFSQWPPKSERPAARAACREMEGRLAEWLAAKFGQSDEG